MIPQLGITICLFLMILSLLRKQKGRADYVLLIWLGVMAVHLLLIAFQKSGFDKENTVLLGILLVIPLLHPALLFVYTLFLTSGKPKLKELTLPFVPFLILLFLTIPFFTLEPAEKVAVFENAGKGYEWYQVTQIILIITTGLFLGILGLLRIEKMKNKMGNHFSNPDYSIIHWLRFLTIGLTVIWILAAFFEEPVIDFGIVIFIVLLGIYGINKAPVFISVTQNLKPAEHSKFKKTGLNNDLAAEQFSKLRELLKTEKLYLNTDLTLADLANQLGLSSSQLSQVINSQSGENFYKLINGLRVQEFIEQASNPANKHLKLEALAFDCGFKSKTTFHKYFKEKTGKTPSDYLQH